MSSDDSPNVKVSALDGQRTSKASSTTQLPDRRTREWSHGVRPPYDPDRLAGFSELNETLAVAVRKKARHEVGFGFNLVPHDSVDADTASDDERETVRDFWYGRDSTWQTKAQQRAEPATPEEVLELARQDYHLVGYCFLEILTNVAGEPVGLAHVPARTVRVRKPQDNYTTPRHPETGEFAADAGEFASRGYIQKRHGRRRYFGEAGDRYRETPVFVDRETGDVAVGSADTLEHQSANELIMVTNPSPLADDYGVPDWVAAIRTIVADEAAKDYNADFFDNDTIPRFAVKVTGGELSEQSREDLRSMLHGLREESHRAVVLEVERFAKNSLPEQDLEIELEPIGQGVSEDMDFREFRQKNEHEIAKVMEVPPVKIGVTESSNRSNSAVQEREFATEVIAPEQHKFGRRLYTILHQVALGVTDWTLEFRTLGADQPRVTAEVAQRKINAVQGAVPINRALELVDEDPLPDDHPVDGATLVCNVGDDGADDSDDAGDTTTQRAATAPPPDRQVGQRDWGTVEQTLVTKDPIEQVQFESSNLSEGLYDFGERELYLSFDRAGQDSLYVYIDVPASVWQSLVAAESHGSYHHDNIRMSYPYEEITNFHSRLPSGPAPDPEDLPDDLPV